MKKDGQRSISKKQGAKKAPGRPPLAGRPTYLRLDDETLRRVEARQKTLQAQNKVSAVGQGDVLRALVRDGLDLAEGQAGNLPADVAKAMAGTEDDAETCFEVAGISCIRMASDTDESRLEDAVQVAANGLKALALLMASRDGR